MWFAGGTIRKEVYALKKMASRGKKIYSFRIDEATKVRFDQLVASRNISRNKLLNHAIRHYLEENGVA